jgi:aspartate-semialdehyde dehydrogenase
MSPPSASGNGGTRVAVVGAATSVGLRIRERLASRGVPGSRVDLYGANRGEALLSEYAGEARLVQEPEPGEVGGHDVTFLCERGALTSRVAAEVARGAVVIDLVGALVGAERPPRIHMDINPPSARDADGRYAVPHPLAILLADLLEPVRCGPGLDGVVAVILRPAADFGHPAIEELREQTVRLLSFVEVPAETFGRQLAFNVIPQAGLGCEPPGLEEEIGRDLMELLGDSMGLVTLRLLTVPVFYGHSVQLHVRPRGAVSRDRIEELLSARGVSITERRGDVVTPLDVSGESTTVAFDVSEDGAGGLWLQAVAGEVDSRGAEHAVRLADAVCGL